MSETQHGGPAGRGWGRTPPCAVRRPRADAPRWPQAWAVGRLPVRLSPLRFLPFLVPRFPPVALRLFLATCSRMTLVLLSLRAAPWPRASLRNLSSALVRTMPFSSRPQGQSLAVVQNDSWRFRSCRGAYSSRDCPSGLFLRGQCCSATQLSPSPAAPREPPARARLASARL